MHPPSLPRPLLITADRDLAEEVAQAAGSVELEVAADARGARRTWSTAPVVLVGDDAVPGCVALGLPRRPGLAVVAQDLDEPAVWHDAVAVGAERVLDPAAACAWLTAALGAAADAAHPAAPLVAVVGGRGGAGASTVAAALAVTAGRRGLPALLVDADSHGGGLDLLFGAEGAAGVRWPALAGTRGRLAAPALARALPVVAPGVALLSWDRGASEVADDAAASVLAAGRRSHALVVADVGRVLDATGRAALAAATTVLVVVPAEVRAAAGAARMAAVAAAACADVRVVVRRPSPGGLRPDELARALGLPLAAQVDGDDALPSQAERGEPPAARGRGQLAAAAAELLGALLGGERHEQAA